MTDKQRRILPYFVFHEDYKSMAQIEREKNQKMAELTYMVNLPIEKPKDDGTVGM